MPTVLAPYSKFVAAALTALVAVVAIVFGANAVVSLAVAAAVAPFAVLIAPANKPA